MMNADSFDFTNDSGTVYEAKSSLMHERKELMYFAAFCIIVSIIVGLSGNLLTIVALLRCPRVRSATAAFIISLCVADFLFCALNLPFSASRFIHQKWIHGDILCVMFPFMRYVNVGLSLMSITAITINRYILIVHQRMYEKIYRKCYIAIMIAAIWLFSFAMLLPTLIGVWGRFGYDKKILNCSILTVNGKSSKTFLFIFGFLIPCVTIIVCYARIFWVLKTSASRVRAYSNSETKEQKKNRDAKKRKEEWRVTRMVLIIFCSFLVCYLPITIVKVADKQAKYPALHIVGYILIYISASINPIIYGVTNKQYRQAYETVLMCRRPRSLSVSANVSNTNDPSINPYTLVSNVAQNSKDDSVFVDERV
ncbi:G-protein coupled receptor moody-like [Tachypleus tridentatus]|uniref:G-protein coupled receptor moody-like n=1 Tax=Tachypleus tridentatus TaxID=6853 RepID=UPI003FD09CF0